MNVFDEVGEVIVGVMRANKCALDGLEPCRSSDSQRKRSFI